MRYRNLLCSPFRSNALLVRATTLVRMKSCNDINVELTLIYGVRQAIRELGGEPLIRHLESDRERTRSATISASCNSRPNCATSRKIDTQVSQGRPGKGWLAGRVQHYGDSRLSTGERLRNE
jgi:hypothetical protein